MNKTQILKSALGEFRRSKDELLFLCPFCKHHKHKFSVNTNTDKYKYNGMHVPSVRYIAKCLREYHECLSSQK